MFSSIYRFGPPVRDEYRRWQCAPKAECEDMSDLELKPAGSEEDEREQDGGEEEVETGVGIPRASTEGMDIDDNFVNNTDHEGSLTSVDSVHVGSLGRDSPDSMLKHSERGTTADSQLEDERGFMPARQTSLESRHPTQDSDGSDAVNLRRNRESSAFPTPFTPCTPDMRNDDRGTPTTVDSGSDVNATDLTVSRESEARSVSYAGNWAENQDALREKRHPARPAPVIENEEKILDDMIAEDPRERAARMSDTEENYVEGHEEEDATSALDIDDEERPPATAPTGPTPPRGLWTPPHSPTEGNSPSTSADTGIVASPAAMSLDLEDLEVSDEPADDRDDEDDWNAIIKDEDPADDESSNNNGEGAFRGIINDNSSDNDCVSDSDMSQSDADPRRSHETTSADSDDDGSENSDDDSSDDSDRWGLARRLMANLVPGSKAKSKGKRKEKRREEDSSPPAELNFFNDSDSDSDSDAVYDDDGNVVPGLRRGVLGDCSSGDSSSGANHHSGVSGGESDDEMPRKKRYRTDSPDREPSLTGSGSSTVGDSSFGGLQDGTPGDSLDNALELDNAPDDSLNASFPHVTVGPPPPDDNSRRPLSQSERAKILHILLGNVEDGGDCKTVGHIAKLYPELDTIKKIAAAVGVDNAEDEVLFTIEKFMHHAAGIAEKDGFLNDKRVTRLAPRVQADLLRLLLGTHEPTLAAGDHLQRLYGMKWHDIAAWVGAESADAVRLWVARIRKALPEAVARGESLKL